MAGREAELLQGTLDNADPKDRGTAATPRIRACPADSANLKESLQIRRGSLYPALYRLERRGWLKSGWKTTNGGCDAKYYSLAKVGRQQLEAETAGWKRLCEAISLVLETRNERSQA